MPARMTSPLNGLRTYLIAHDSTDRTAEFVRRHEGYMWVFERIAGPALTMFGYALRAAA